MPWKTKYLWIALRVSCRNKEVPVIYIHFKKEICFAYDISEKNKKCPRCKVDKLAVVITFGIVVGLLRT